MTYVTLATSRDGYSPDQCGKTLTVQQLIDILSGFEPESKIYLSNDNGYTYGAIRDYSFDEIYEEDDDEENEE